MKEDSKKRKSRVSSKSKSPARKRHHTSAEPNSDLSCTEATGKSPHRHRSKQRQSSLDRKPKKSRSSKSKKKRKRSNSSSSSTSTSSSSSSSERKRKKKKSKKKKKKSTKSKEKSWKLVVKQEAAKAEEAEQDVVVDQVKIVEAVPSGSRSGPQPRVMKPMTKEEWDKQQSVIRRVYDAETGRERIIKGDGEILEEIVTKDRHNEINKAATRGDGVYYAKQMGLM